MKYSTILFDFDGTLVDSSGTILPSVKRTYEEMGLAMPDDALLKKFIGPPLHESFRIMGMCEENEIARAIEIYRRVFNKNDYSELKMYTGMKPLLHRLISEGVAIAVASVRMEDKLLEICGQMGLDNIFPVICGRVEEQEILTKADVVRRALERLGNPNGKAVLIGDSKYDEEGAFEAGVDFIAAMYGFGFESEKDIERSVLIAWSVGEIADYLK